jgi:pimeloyl-ACP methyl ester carboxylesterase
MTEKALLFGDGKSLVGIVTLPPAEPSPADRPGIVILNAGVLHRVGPNRVHVQMARALADLGFTVLRFDFSSIGDSRAREGSRPFEELVVEDIREALAFMERSTGLRRFLVVGICAGADSALQALAAEPRIVAAALIDGHHVESVGFAARLYFSRLLSFRGWVRLLTGRSKFWPALVLAARWFVRPRPSPEQARPSVPSISRHRELLRSAVERGTRLLLVYTENSPALYNYRRHVERPLDGWSGRDRVSVELFDGSDHVFTLRVNQERIVQLLCRWASSLPADPPEEGEAAGSTPPSTTGPSARPA